MPQLVRGGKHVFGWSRIREGGVIRIPPEAIEEYRMREGEELVMLAASRTSGGFALARPEALRGSFLGTAPEGSAGAGGATGTGGRGGERRGGPHPRVRLEGGAVRVGAEDLERYGAWIGQTLLAVRGSGLAIGFAARGPIVEEAGRHPALKVF